MKIFINKKILFILSTYHNKSYIKDFKKKPLIFNDFFAKKFKLINNSNSELSTNSFKGKLNFLSVISFTTNDIVKDIKNLNPWYNKVNQFWKLLNLYFNHALRVENLSTAGRKPVLSWSTINDKELKYKYCPICCCNICGKILELEQIICNKIFVLLTENKLISHNQSGVKPTDVCYYVLPTIFTNRTMTISRQKKSFLIYQKYLEKFGARFYSTSWSKMVYQIIF